MIGGDGEEWRSWFSGVYRDDFLTSVSLGILTVSRGGVISPFDGFCLDVVVEPSFGCIADIGVATAFSTFVSLEGGFCTSLFSSPVRSVTSRASIIVLEMVEVAFIIRDREIWYAWSRGGKDNKLLEKKRGTGWLNIVGVLLSDGPIVEMFGVCKF